MGRVRTTLTLTYEGETKDLAVTFGVIDKISSLVDWASLPVRIGIKGERPLTEMSKLIYYVLAEAGFEPDLDDIFDQMGIDNTNQDQGVLLAMQICKAFAPPTKKKDSPPKSTAKKRKARKKAT